MKRIRMVGMSLILVGMLLAACAPIAAPAPAPAAPAKAAWEVEWDKVLAAAKQEGKVVVGSMHGREIATALGAGFEGAYGIRLEYISGRGLEATQKILSERRAGLYSYDLATGATAPSVLMLKPAKALDPLEPALILPEVKNPQNWYRGEKERGLWWVDKDRTVLAMSIHGSSTIAVNTNLVKEGEIKSYRDVLNPKWKGKIIFTDPTIPSGGLAFLQAVDSLVGRDFVYELAKMEPMTTRDTRQVVEWLAQGKMAVAVAPDEQSLAVFRKVGAPIKDILPEEGTWLSASLGSVSLINKAPHPNAAKVFINWLLSKEGQTIYARASGEQSARLDVPTDFLPPEILRHPNVKYFMKESEEMILKRAEIAELAKELFGPQKK